MYKSDFTQWSPNSLPVRLVLNKKQTELHWRNHLSTQSHVLCAGSSLAGFIFSLLIFISRQSQWRRNEINIEGPRQGPKGWARAGVKFLGRGGKPPPSPHQLGVWGALWDLLVGYGANEFWCILGSSGELSCSPAIRPGSHSLQLLWLGS